MKLDDSRHEGVPAAFQSPVIAAQPRQQDETHQEQMRRLHNARARQRAARQHRISHT